MPTLIRSQKDIASATTADLVYSYNAFTGKSISRFSSRGAGESQLANAILAAENAAAQLGVKKGAKPLALTVEELAKRREDAAKGSASTETETPTSAAARPRAAQSAKGSLRARLAEKAKGDPNKPRPKPQKSAAAVGRAPKVTHVEPTGAGITKLHSGSERRKVLEAIEARHAKTHSPVELAGLEIEGLEGALRGYIQKLLVTGHIRSVAAPGAK